MHLANHFFQEQILSSGRCICQFASAPHEEADEVTASVEGAAEQSSTVVLEWMDDYFGSANGGTLKTHDVIILTPV